MVEQRRQPRRGQLVERVSDAFVSTQAEADRLAQALMKQRLDRLFTASGELLGDPRVRAGKSIEIRGVGRFDGRYYMTSVTHTLGDAGYQTSFDARRNTRPQEAEAE